MIDVVQYRFRIGTYQGTGAKGRGPGRIHFSGQFRDSSMFNPYNRSESILFYTLDTTSGVWMANLLHSPMKHINLAFVYVYLYIHHITYQFLYAFLPGLIIFYPKKSQF